MTTPLLFFMAIEDLYFLSFRVSSFCPDNQILLSSADQDLLYAAINLQACHVYERRTLASSKSILDDLVKSQLFHQKGF